MLDEFAADLFKSLRIFIPKSNRKFAYRQEVTAIVDVLQHYGVLGMKWGVRRYQNKDGTLTNAGRTRYADADGEGISARRKSTAKKVAIGTAAVAGMVLTAYLVKKHGAKKTAELTTKVETGKAVAEKLMASTSIASKPVSQLQTSRSSIRPSVETGKRVAEEVSKTISSSASKPANAIQSSVETGKRIAEEVSKTISSSASKPVNTIQSPPAYDFAALMKQNDELLKKMYADLLS